MSALRDKAFALYDQGFLPISAELKALPLKARSRATYYYEWRKERGLTASGGGESVGGVMTASNNESPPPSPEEVEPTETPELIVSNPEDDLEDPDDEEPPEGDPEEKEPKTTIEAISGISEAQSSKNKDGKTIPERKVATSVADEGIKCVVFLNLETLALFKYAATIQANSGNGHKPLLLGDFLDTTVRDFFEVRGKKLGLINTGGE